MARARVWNDNRYPYKELFKGKEITIGAGEFIPMDYDDAMEFKSSFSPIQTDGEGNPLAQFYKKLRVEVLEEVKTQVPLVCHATGKVAGSEAELKAMLAQHSDMLDDPNAARADDRTKALEAEILELKAQVGSLAAALAPKPEKRGPGRPKKEA